MKIIPKTLKQTLYLAQLKNISKPVSVVCGPAGSGKTLFACQVAAERLADKDIRKIIITRPSVAVDEDLGHLPGDINDKMSPWTRPMFDIFENYFSTYRIKQLVEDKTLEIVPLGFMRGRTFDHSYIIADEMQNSTINQMKMVLTRLGEESNMTITGDPEQCDIVPRENSGLIDLLYRLEEYSEQLDYINKIVLDSEDIQRHPAIKEILEVYGGLPSQSLHAIDAGLNP